MLDTIIKALKALTGAGQTQETPTPESKGMGSQTAKLFTATPTPSMSGRPKLDPPKKQPQQPNAINTLSHLRQLQQAVSSVKNPIFQSGSPLKDQLTKAGAQIHDVTAVSPDVQNNFKILGTQIDLLAKASLKTDKKITGLEDLINKRIIKAAELQVKQNDKLMQSVSTRIGTLESFARRTANLYKIHDTEMTKLRGELNRIKAEVQGQQRGLASPNKALGKPPVKGKDSGRGGGGALLAGIGIGALGYAYRKEIGAFVSEYVMPTVKDYFLKELQSLWQKMQNNSRTTLGEHLGIGQAERHQKARERYRQQRESGWGEWWRENMPTGKTHGMFSGPLDLPSRKERGMVGGAGYKGPGSSGGSKWGGRSNLLGSEDAKAVSGGSGGMSDVTISSAKDIIISGKKIILRGEVEVQGTVKGSGLGGGLDGLMKGAMGGLQDLLKMQPKGKSFGSGTPTGRAFDGDPSRRYDNIEGRIGSSMRTDYGAGLRDTGGYGGGGSSGSGSSAPVGPAPSATASRARSRLAELRSAGIVGGGGSAPSAPISGTSGTRNSRGKWGASDSEGALPIGKNFDAGMRWMNRQRAMKYQKSASIRSGVSFDRTRMGLGAPRTAQATPLDVLKDAGYSDARVGGIGAVRGANQTKGIGKGPGRHYLGLRQMMQGRANQEPDIEDLSEEARLVQRGKFRGDVRGMTIHHTSGHGDAMGVAHTLRTRRNKSGQLMNLGVQYVVDREGKIKRMMPEGTVGAHMRDGQNLKRSGIDGRGMNNFNMAGVEVIAHNNDDVLPEQIEAVRQLTRWHSKKYGYDPQTGLVGHGEINSHKESNEGQAFISRFRSGELDLNSSYNIAGPNAPKPQTGKYANIGGGLSVPRTPNPTPGFAKKDAAGTGPLSADENRKIDPVQFQRRMEDKIASSSLNGFAPEWGKKFGIEKGTPREWARLFTMVQQQESGHRTAQVNKDGSLKRFSTTRPTEKSFGPGQFNVGEYGLNSWEDVNNPDKVGDAYIKVAEQGKLFKYFGSLKRSNETLQHAGWYDTNVAPNLDDTKVSSIDWQRAVKRGQILPPRHSTLRDIQPGAIGQDGAPGTTLRDRGPGSISSVQPTLLPNIKPSPLSQPGTTILKDVGPGGIGGGAYAPSLTSRGTMGATAYGPTRGVNRFGFAGRGLSQTGRQIPGVMGPHQAAPPMPQRKPYTMIPGTMGPRAPARNFAAGMASAGPARKVPNYAAGMSSAASRPSPSMEGYHAKRRGFMKKQKAKSDRMDYTSGMKKAASTPESGKTLPVPSKGRKGGDPGGGDNGNRIRSPRNNNKGETQAAGPGDAGSGGEKQCYI